MSKKKYVPLQKRLAEQAAGVKEHSEQSIQALLYDHNDSKSGVKYTMSSVYVYSFEKFRWETDFFLCTTSFHSEEHEIKINISDFRRDKKKEKKHKFLSDVFHNRSEATEFFIPNRMYYCAPKGIIPVDEVPEYAGLEEVLDNGKIFITKPAPLITENPSSKLIEKMADRFYKKSKRDEMNYISFIESLRKVNKRALTEVEQNTAINNIIETYRKNKRI